jgi:hypothetical protein
MDPGTLPAVKVPATEIIPDGLLFQVKLVGYLSDAPVRKLGLDFLSCKNVMFVP